MLDLIAIASFAAAAASDSRSSFLERSRVSPELQGIPMPSAEFWLGEEVRKGRGLAMRELRLRLGLSQVEMGERVGVGQMGISRLERGIRLPSTQVVVRYRDLARTSEPVSSRKSRQREWLAEEKKLRTKEGASLRELRLRLGLNQTEMGARVGVSQVKVSRFERGLSRPAPQVVARYEDLASSLDETYGRKPPHGRPAGFRPRRRLRRHRPHAQRRFRPRLIRRRRWVTYDPWPWQFWAQPVVYVEPVDPDAVSDQVLGEMFGPDGLEGLDL
jgi:transcriptional regulator with XRE-family HTH domain